MWVVQLRNYICTLIHLNLSLNSHVWLVAIIPKTQVWMEPGEGGFPLFMLRTQ